MDSGTKDKLAKLLKVDGMMLERLDAVMSKRTGKIGVMERLAKQVEEIVDNTLNTLNSNNRSTSHVRSVLRTTILNHEKHLMSFVEKNKGINEFDKAARLAKKIAKIGKGFFLKKEFAQKIIEKRNPVNLLKYLGVKTVSAALLKHDVTELFSALRFTESDEWMHETFDASYSNFTADDFEEREIEIKVLGPEWREISQKFVAKKHHNVSHLKEFGVIFLNPIQENIPGKFLRDFALLLHYFHEVEFYSKLFNRYSKEENFTDKLKMLLRGDVPEVYKAEPGEWLIVQRYLAKVNPEDPRLYLPRVNPESMHWARGERDLTSFQAPDSHLDLKLWYNLDWVGGIFADGGDEVVSFDLEDNAMSLVSFMEGKEESFNYHQRESMWTKIFAEYVGGEEKMEELLIENFDKGMIKF
ncbi:MAG: hypothetical protein AAB617_02985 [Patescibacteria group bacterium]